MPDFLEDLQKYWAGRADGYSQVNQEELAGAQRARWGSLLGRYLPERAPELVEVLDVGTGPGFFAIVLAQLGYRVTAADYSEEMLCAAKENAKRAGGAQQIRWVQRDAQNLGFEDGSFDAVVTRNLTWNLPDPEKAYREWNRVLKKAVSF